MPTTDREFWLLNFYRNSELHGALLMGKLARSLADSDLVFHLTQHCAIEAHHAALLSQVILALGGRIDPQPGTIQEHYAAAGGVPTNLADLLVLSETLERRVLVSYNAHLSRRDTHPLVRDVLRAIRQDELEHSGEAGWAEKKLATLPPEQVAAAEAKWRAIDARVAAELTRHLEERFPAVEVRS